MADIKEPAPDDDVTIGRLLRASGGREQPASDLQRHVRAAVHAEWRATVAQRGRARQRLWLAAAAAVLGLVAGLWVMQERLAAPGVVVASVSRVAGTVSAQSQSSIAWLSGDQSRMVQAQQQMRAHEILQTGHDGRAGLTVDGAVSLRLDHDTRIAFVEANRIEVLQGAVYVDAGVTPVARKSLLLDTPAGAVRHVGTQYEVRVLRTGTRISVREGRVELSDRSGATERLAAGEQLLVTRDGTRSRSGTASHDLQWSWIAEVAPPFDIEGRSLSDFLDWVARETGRKLVFADPASETEATAAILHGSVATLSPDEALQVVLPTTRLRGRVSAGNLLIDMP